MKTTHFFYILLAVILFSCGQQKENELFGELDFNNYDNNQDDQEPNIQQNNNFQKTNNSEYKFHKLMDPQFGIPSGAMQIPTSWRESNNKKENLLFEGPNGLKVFKAVSNYSQYNTPIKDLNRFINEDLKPMANKGGFRFVKQYPLPQMEQFDARLDSYMYKSTPEQKQFQCIVTEWENNEGVSSIMIIRYYVSRLQMGGTYWGFTINCLEAPKGSFEEAKNNYINGLLNFQLNPQWVQVNNQYWQQKAQIATAGHNQRMAAIKSFGDANTARYNSRMAASDAQYNSWRAGQAASDAQYSSWRAVQASSDAGQSNYVDGIWEQRNMTNATTGQTYKIEGYDNNVWMNGNNEYIGNDNSLYNPNTDNTMNNQNWTQLEDTNNY